MLYTGHAEKYRKEICKFFESYFYLVVVVVVVAITIFIFTITITIFIFTITISVSSNLFHKPKLCTRLKVVS